MLYVLNCQDRSDVPGLRQSVRPKHLLYIEGLGRQIVVAGPVLAPDGATPVGSLLIVEAETDEAARAIAEQDPYHLAGLFASVTVTPFRLVYLNPPA